MNTHNQIASTRQPKLTRAVIAQLGGTENLEAIAAHSADAGWPGFTYYSDTVAFFEANRDAIAERISADAQELGYDSTFAMIRDFGCLKHDSPSEMSIFRALGGGKLRDEDETLANALAWYALEEIAREMCPNA